MFFLYLFGGIIVLNFLYSYLKGLFTKGIITKGYFYIDDDIQELYLINNYETSEWSRQGSYDTHKYKIEKFDLNTLEYKFETNISFYLVRSVFDDIGYAFGLDSNYFYYFINKKRLLIVDMKTGKKIAGRKTILKHNPNIKNFNVLDSKYCNTREELIVNDNTGKKYALEMKTLKLNPFKQKLRLGETGISLPSFDDIPSMKFNQYDYEERESRSYFYFPHDLDVDFADNKGTDRKFVNIMRKGENVKQGENRKSFLYPKVIGERAEKFPYVDIGEPVLIIAHAPLAGALANEILISAVQNNSSELWSHSMGELFIKPEFNNDHILSYIELKDALVFMLLTGEPHRISMSKVDKKSGKILLGPMLSINRKIKKKTS